MDDELPSKGEMLGNFLSTVKGQFFQSLEDGTFFCNSQAQKERLKICSKCPSLQDDMRCVKCGCFVKIKATLHFPSCPDGLWR